MIKVLAISSILVALSVAAAYSGPVRRARFMEFLAALKLRVTPFLPWLARSHRDPKIEKSADHPAQTGLFDDPAFGRTQDTEAEDDLQTCPPPDMSVLNCRVRIVELKEGDTILDGFSVEICGSIHAPESSHNATLRISILDVTDGTADPAPVRPRDSRGPASGESVGPEFCYRAELGRLPRQTTTLDDWTQVARLHTDHLQFCRRGERTLHFETSVESVESGHELARAQCMFIYENPLPGYADLRENAERTRVLAVALAFAVSAADGKLYDCEIELIKDWARDNILDTRDKTSGQSSGKLEKALSTTVAFFREGNKLDTRKLCEEIVGIASLGQRYEVLELSMRVAQANGKVSPEEMATLKDFALWLEVDGERVRAMMEKILPVDIREVMDIEDLLGITSDMGRERTRKHLNREYSKWNSRVTSADPDIQTQADQMLKIIAEARGQYVTTD